MSKRQTTTIKYWLSNFIPLLTACQLFNSSAQYKVRRIDFKTGYRERNENSSKRADSPPKKPMWGSETYFKHNICGFVMKKRSRRCRVQTCFELLVTFLSPLLFFLVRDSADDLAGAMPSGYKLLRVWKSFCSLCFDSEKMHYCFCEEVWRNWFHESWIDC